MESRKEKIQKGLNNEIYHKLNTINMSNEFDTLTSTAQLADILDGYMSKIENKNLFETNNDLKILDSIDIDVEIDENEILKEYNNQIHETQNEEVVGLETLSNLLEEDNSELIQNITAQDLIEIDDNFDMTIDKLEQEKNTENTLIEEEIIDNNENDFFEEEVIDNNENDFLEEELIDNNENDFLEKEIIDNNKNLEEEQENISNEILENKRLGLTPKKIDILVIIVLIMLIILILYKRLGV